MINTNINGYLQYERVEQLYTSQTKESNVLKETESKNEESVMVNISEQSKAMLKIEDLKEQLIEIFGVKKNLSPKELEQEKELQEKIEKIKEKIELPYSQSDLESIKKINIEIEKILDKGYYRSEDDDKIFDLTKEIHQISKEYGPPKLSGDDKEEFAKLNKELRELQGYNDPDDTQLLEAEKIFTKIDIIKTELSLSELSSTSTGREKLEEKIDSLNEKLNKLNTSKDEYEREEIRENAKFIIQQSISNIGSIKNAFYNGDDDYFANLSASYSSSLTTTAPKENKFLDFLQSTRKELYSGSSGLEAKEQEDYKLQKLVDRVNELHGK